MILLSLSLSRFNVLLANFGTLLLILNFFLFITCTWTIRKRCNQAIKQLAFTYSLSPLPLGFWLLCLCFMFCGYLFTSRSWQFLVSLLSKTAWYTSTVASQPNAHASWGLCSCSQSLCAVGGVRAAVILPPVFVTYTSKSLYLYCHSNFKFLYHYLWQC